MTIDEAIQHAEETEKEKKQKAEMFKTFRDYSVSYNMQKTAKDCEACAEIYEQLVSWLKELKKYREVWVDVREELKVKRNEYSDCGLVGISSGISRSMDIIDKHLSEVQDETVL